MAKTTESKETLSRKEFATYLRNLADQFESDGETRIQVGNKSVTVHPGESVECEVTVTERSAILRGDKEALDLEAKWKKSERQRDDEGELEREPEEEREIETERESDPESGPESESESGPESRTGGD